MVDAPVYSVRQAGGVPVGCIGALLKSDFPHFLVKPGFYAFVGFVYTIPGMRGHGIASTLLNNALAWAESKGASHVRLLPTEASRRIYERAVSAKWAARCR